MNKIRGGKNFKNSCFLGYLKYYRDLKLFIVPGEQNNVFQVVKNMNSFNKTSPNLQIRKEEFLKRIFSQNNDHKKDRYKLSANFFIF